MSIKYHASELELLPPDPRCNAVSGLDLLLKWLRAFRTDLDDHLDLLLTGIDDSGRGRRLGR